MATVTATDLIRTADLVAAGYSLREQRRAVAGMTRVAAGTYARTAAMSPEEVHRVRTEAVLGRVGRVAASYATAAVLWELPVRAGDLRDVHVSPTSARPARPSSRNGYVMRSPAVADEEIALRLGLPTTDALRTVLDCARLLDPDWGVVIGDAAVHRGLITLADLGRAAQEMHRLKGAGRARTLQARCSPLSESPGESLLRLRLQRMGVEPREQVSMPWVEGSPRVDFLIDDWLVVEFDGQGKYAMKGDIARAHWEEKIRHDRLIEAGHDVVHVIWAHLWDEPRLRQRVQRARSRQPRIPPERES